MAVLREEELDGFLKRRLASFNGILIHGVDETAVAQVGRQVPAALGGEVQRMDMASLRSEPSALLDQFLALSMFGDRQVFQVDGADEAALKFLERTFTHDKPANFIIVTTGSLGKSSKLRVAAEEAPLWACLAIYEEDDGKLRQRVAKILANDRLSWGNEAEAAFFAAVGTDRGISAREAEKLALYCKGRERVEVEDVEAICGDTAEFDVDQLIDAVLKGELEETDRIFATQASEMKSFMPLFVLHLARLQNLRADMERGASADAVVRNAKPPIFFKRQPAYVNQLRRLSLSDLITIGTSLQTASLQSRKNAALADAITSRSLLSIARHCRQAVTSV